MSAVPGTETARPAIDGRLEVVLASVLDPEIPVLSVLDLGIVRHARCEADGSVRVGVSPTYSGCPAAEVIKASIVHALRGAGFDRTTIVEVLSPPWSSDWITAEGRRKLHAYGIAPPAHAVANVRHLARGELSIACPRCGSQATEELSEFGSTPCKALHRCKQCLEPFDSFKCI